MKKYTWFYSYKEVFDDLTIDKLLDKQHKYISAAISKQVNKGSG